MQQVKVSDKFGKNDFKVHSDLEGKPQLFSRQSNCLKKNEK